MRRDLAALDAHGSALEAALGSLESGVRRPFRSLCDSHEGHGGAIEASKRRFDALVEDAHRNERRMQQLEALGGTVQGRLRGREAFARLCVGLLQRALREYQTLGCDASTSPPRGQGVAAETRRFEACQEELQDARHQLEDTANKLQEAEVVLALRQGVLAESEASRELLASQNSSLHKRISLLQEQIAAKPTGREEPLASDRSVLSEATANPHRDDVRVQCRHQEAEEEVGRLQTQVNFLLADRRFLVVELLRRGEPG